MNDRKARRREVEEDDDLDEVPVAKKKNKKKKKPATLNRLKIAGFCGMGLLLVLLAGVVIWAVLQASNVPPAQPVTAWEKFKTDDGEIGLEYPAGWAPGNYGKKGSREIEIKGKGAKITIAENIAGSVIGDIAGAAAGGQPVPEHRTAVAQVHEMRKPKDSSSYKEEGAVSVMTKLGKARCSPYTDGNRKGYRATMLLNQTALDIFCECRASDWDVLRPAFDRMLESLQYPNW